jgi:glutamine amidotransferase
MTPKEDDLMTAVVNNPDGCGWAIIHGDKIKLSREMKGSKAVVKFLADREQYPDGWALFHARIATHGTVGLDNCHPFKVGGDSRVLFAHNGILNISLSEGDLRSDSRTYCQDYLSPTWMIGSTLQCWKRG